MDRRTDIETDVFFTGGDAGFQDDEDVDNFFELPDPNFGQFELVVNDQAHHGPTRLGSKLESIET
jgi:hypothetical protein